MLCTCLLAYLACLQPRLCPHGVIFSSSLKGHGRTSLKSSKACVCLCTCFETTLICPSRQLSFVNLLMWCWCICSANEMQCLLAVPQENVDHIFYCMSPCEKSHCCRSCLCTEKSPGWKKILASSIWRSIMFSPWSSVFQILCLLNISLDSSASCNAVIQPHPLIYLGCWFFSAGQNLSKFIDHCWFHRPEVMAVSCWLDVLRTPLSSSPQSWSKGVSSPKFWTSLCPAQGRFQNGLR